MTLPGICNGSLELVFVTNTQATPFRCGVFQILVDGCQAGTISFVGTAPGEARIGYEVMPRFRRQGIASRAVGALIAAAPGFGVRTLRAECRSNNIPSKRILEKSGFVQHSKAPFWANGNDASLMFLVYLWLAPAAAVSEFEGCVQ